VTNATTPASPWSSAPHIGTAELELVAAEGWRPLESHRLGDWQLRASGGFTGRANSALVVGNPGVTLGAAVDYVIDWYRSRSLRPTFAIPLPLRKDVDDALGEAGWTRFNLTDVLTTKVEPLTHQKRAAAQAGSEYSIQVGRKPDADWLASYRYRGESLPPHAVKMMTNAAHPVFVTVRTDAAVAAIARGAITPGWLGITAVEVDEGHRRRGLGTHVVQTLAEYAARQGCDDVYLQVTNDNVSAHALYARLGFTSHHQYVYRALDGSSGSQRSQRSRR
jgi:ribosomal protein S18 acetylase RimI-like enzyme